MELNIKVEKTKLITALKQNKAKHIADYKEATMNWKKELRSIVESAHDLLTNKQDYDLFLDRKHDIFRIDSRPTSHEKDYDTAIEMLEFCSDQEIELDIQQYNAFVKDQWTWRAHWSASNAKYLSHS